MQWYEIVVTIICSVIASSGFWAYLQHRHDKNDSATRLILGLAHDRIMSLGGEYIERGWITSDEYENLYSYLYIPYHEQGGNGSATRIMDEVKKLPIKAIHVSVEH